MKRRDFLTAASALSVAGCAGSPTRERPRVLVIGAGFGGATVAKYVRLWDPNISVMLVDRGEQLVSCPTSNLVLGGNRTMQQITHPYEGLRKYGVQLLNGEAVALDPVRRTVTFGRGSVLTYDRLVLSPGVDFLDEIEGFAGQERILHAWKAGAQTVALRAQLEAMPDGGTFVLGVPLAPYRCAPGPYERACQVAHYFKRAKPRSKIIVLDANPDITSKAALFRRAWQDLYPGMIEYRPSSAVVAVDAATLTARTEFEAVKADVVNIVPPQRAADIARNAGLVTTNRRWCDVDWRTLESKAVKGIHVLGDATFAAPGMPKSAHMANAQAKVCAAALVELLNDREPNPAPLVSNTCYSFVSDREAIHVASVHQYDAAQDTLVPVRGAGGVSDARSELEAQYGWSWARNIWADTLG